MSDLPDFGPGCPFCRVASGELAAATIAEGPEVFAMVSPLAVGPGHSLVVPRRHVVDVYDLPPDLGGPILAMASRVARAAKRALGAEGTLLRQHNEPAGGQEVFHFHLHVIPRFTGDAERVNGAPGRIRFAEQQAIAEKLRAALEA
jgi:histidine triad (HIT) family protein